MSKFTEEQIQESVKAFELAMRQGSENGIQHSFDMGLTWKSEPDGIYEAFGFTMLHRIKPAPKLRAWKLDEVPVGALFRDSGTNNRHLITGVSKDGRVFIANPANDEDRENGFCTIDFLKDEHSLDGGKTWLPCGVLES